MSFVLRDYQKDCVDSVISAFKAGHKKVAAILPTGAGKTEIFIAINDRFLTENPASLVLNLSHLDILTDQTYKRFQVRCPHIPVEILQAQCIPSPSARAIVGTMQSTRIEDKIEKWIGSSRDKVGLVVVDECHYIQTDSYDKIMAYFPNANLLGVTATPFRSGTVMTNFFDVVAYSISLMDLIEEGRLVKPILNQIVAHPGGLEDRIAQVISIYKAQELGKKALIFLQTMEDAKTCADSFIDNGINAETITCEITGKNRDKVLASFKEGNVDVVTTVNVLSAGFDYPKLEAIFMPYATTSPTMYMQRIGRGLRPEDGDCVKPHHTKQTCRVYAMGTAPSIKSGVFERLNKLVLRKGRKKYDDCTTCYEELEYYESIYDNKSQEYLWTKQMCAIADRLKKLNMYSISEWLSRREFPKKFMEEFIKLEKYITDFKYEKATSKVSDIQRQILYRFGFSDPQIFEMNKKEAAQLIAAHYKQRVTEEGQDKYIMRSGRYVGKHVSTLLDRNMWFYRQYITGKGRYTAIAKQYFEWCANNNINGG